MAEFKLSQSIDKNKVFIVNLSKIEGRMDPYFYKEEFNELRAFFNNNDFIDIGELLISWNRGDGPRNGFYTEAEDGVYFLRVNNLKNNSIDLTDVKLINRKIHETKLKRTQVKGGDLIFAISGTKDNLGTVSIIPNSIKEANLNSALVRLDLDKNRILNEFFCILFDLKFIRVQIDFIGKGAAQNNLNNEEIKSIRIPNVSIEFQKKIISLMNQKKELVKQKEAEAKALLDSIDSYLLGELGIVLPDENEPVTEVYKSASFSLDAENMLVKNGRLFMTGAKDLRGGRFDAFYRAKYFDKVWRVIENALYPIAKLKDCICFIESGNRPSGGVSQYENGILSFGGEHINSFCEIDIKKPKFIPIDFHKNNLKTKTELNNILVVKDGATTGKIAIIENKDHTEQNINEHLFMIKALKNCIPHYIAYYLHSQAGQIQIKRGITGATVTGITKEIIKKIILPIPPIEKQNEIIQHISTIRKKAEILTNEAKQVLEDAKSKVEQMILGN